MPTPPDSTAAHHPHADTWFRSVKATAVDTAHRAVGELTLLVGATAFQAHFTPARARNDLTGLLYADGRSGTARRGLRPQGPQQIPLGIGQLVATYRPTMIHQSRSL